MSTTAVNEAINAVKVAFEVAEKSMERTMDSVENLTRFDCEVKLMTVDGRDVYVIG